MLVRIQSSALVSRWCNGRPTTADHAAHGARAVPDSPKVLVLFRWQVATPYRNMARECAGQHVSFRSGWTRFDSWTGYWTTRPASVMDGMADFESAGRGSIPRRGAERETMSPECAGFAREPAKLEDQVRFLAATLQFRFRDGTEVSQGRAEEEQKSRSTGSLTPASNECFTLNETCWFVMRGLHDRSHAGQMTKVGRELANFEDHWLNRSGMPLPSFAARGAVYPCSSPRRASEKQRHELGR